MAAHDDVDQDEGSILLLETEPPSREPIFSKHRAQRTSPLRFTLATALLVLGGLAAFYLWTTGRPAYNEYSRYWNPHSTQLYFRNGTAAKETELVRSLFGRAKDLGVDKFDLVASVYYMHYPESFYYGGRQFVDESNSTLANVPITADATPTSTETAARALVSMSTMVDSNGEISFLDHGGEDWKPPPEPEWQRIFSAPVIRELQVSYSGGAVVQVVLPGKIVAALRDESRGRTELKATFHLIPSESTIPFYAANSTYYLGDTKDSDRYGYHGFGGSREDFPLPYPAIGRNVSEQSSTVQPWESRIPGSPSVNLMRQIYPPWQRDEERFVDEAKHEVEDEEDDVEGEKKAKKTAPWREDVESDRPTERTVLVKRSTVTLIEQSPVYSLPKFQKKMRVLERREEGCRRGQRRWETCTRTFTNRGHFEFLLEMARAEGPDLADTQSSTDNIVRYRYPPFLHSNYGRLGPRDYTNLSEATGAENDDESDFPFDWHVWFSPISAGKAASAEAYHDVMRGRDFNGFGDDHMIFDHPGDVNALWQDQAELLNAIMDHSFSPNSHPILRLVLLNLVGVASLASTVLTAYFWYSRIISTGISLSAHAIDTVVRFVAFGAGVVQRGDKIDWMMSPVVVLISALVWSLCARLEWVGGGPKEMVLVGVRRRRATKGERASAREDGKFTWLMWGGLVVFAFIFTTVLLPMLPPIMTESLPTPFPSKLLTFLTPIVQVSSVQLLASQLHLNHRLSKFGANYRLVPFLDLASAVLSVIPVLLSAWWGRWETMPAFGWAELCWVVGKTALPWQAWMYPRCEQREEGEQ